MVTSLHQIAHALRGDVVSGGVSFPPPGHSQKDRSGRFLPDPMMRNGYRAVSLANDDPIALRDYIDAQCGFPQWEPQGSTREPRQIDPAEQARRDRERERHALAREAEAKVKAGRVLRIWAEADPDPGNSMVDTYLKSRELDLLSSVCGHAIRFHRATPWEDSNVPAMICAFRDIHTNEVVGLHRTRLSEDARKLGRKMLGRAAGAAIKLTHDSEVTMGVTIAEGVETGLAALQLGFGPVWALGSVGGIASFPVLGGIESLTVCAETDDSGANQAAVQEVGTRWSAAGRNVLVVTPKAGGDLNDAIREGRR